MSWKTNAIVMFALLLPNCGIFEKDEDLKNTSQTCNEQKASIQTSIDTINQCQSASDCAYEGVNSRWGCYLLFNKNNDTATIQQAIDDYSTSSCWDGMTTLTILDCAAPNELSCQNNKCTF